MTRTVLVVGAQPRSLGGWVAEMLNGLMVYDRPVEEQWRIATAGLGDEEYHMDCYTDSYAALIDLLGSVKPDSIVCTAGVNEPREKHQMLHDWYEEHYRVNVVGPMRLLEAWLTMQDTGAFERGYPRHYVAISSNSAHIARTYSGAYCASKAALSMALRCKARELAGDPVLVYGYEPGLLQGTPMTDVVRERLGNRSLTRIPGQPDGLPTHRLANLIARNLVWGGSELNGCLLRVDGGDQ